MVPAELPTLFLLCGKIASGKSALARRLAVRPTTLLISEDQWASRLFPGELNTIDDYALRSARLRDAIGPLVVDVLRIGASVVLDFPANVVEYRAWMRTLFTQARAAHELHYLDVPDAICKMRLRERNAKGEHPFEVSETDFDQFTRHFVPPSPDENFNLVVHRP